jgi:hypothetical protein
MANFSITVDLGALMATQAVLADEVFSALSASVKRVVDVGEERWKTAVLSAPLWDGERRAYAASIHGVMLSPFAGEISSNYKYVQDIETGRPPYDLKKMLDTSLKVRLSKKGNRYLIIPFRHNTPGNVALAPAMPKHVYAEAKMLKASRLQSYTSRLSWTGAWDIKTKQPVRVRTRKYVWGGRLPAGLTPKLKPEHATDIHDSMVRFKDNTTGGSTYMTFRTMSSKSSGWIIPAKPGLGIAMAVADSLQRMADSDFPDAIAQDLANAAPKAA